MNIILHFYYYFDYSVYLIQEIGQWSYRKLKLRQKDSALAYLISNLIVGIENSFCVRNIKFFCVRRFKILKSRVGSLQDFLHFPELLFLIDLFSLKGMANSKANEMEFRMSAMGGV